ncbi:MAG: HEAT repeat domain-containing protein, partial [Robiginitalea sp.]|nr:HEAT repeat domain-containing protein [Robiginitalea sp.]
YRQSDASKAIITLLQHRSPEIQTAALECIREFRFAEARTPMKQQFENAITEIKILILDALREVATDEDLPWLQKRPARDPSFLVRNKASMVINVLKPETVLPTKDIRTAPPWEAAFDREAETPVTSGEPALTPEAPGEFERADKKEFGIPKADFNEIRWDPEWDPDWPVSREIHLPVPEINLGALPEEEWTPEHEQIFAHCFLEELKELLSLGSGSVSLPEVSLDFLPVITKEPSNTTPMEPHESIPEWLRKLDVQAEILSADSGYAKVLREILLGDLAEYGEVFNTDFVPWVTGDATTKASNAAGSPPEPELDPDFEVFADGIHQLHWPNDGTPPQDETEMEAHTPEGEMNYFSIFREFFRSYDREAKLILLDEIPEIGTVKELHFLEEVFEDPDEKVANRARKVYQLLARRLEVDPEALENKGSQALWTPSYPSKKNASPEKKQPHALTGDEDPQEDECSFIPEFDPLGVPQQRFAQKTRKRKNRLFRFLGGTQHGADE